VRPSPRERPKFGVFLLLPPGLGIYIIRHGRLFIGREKDEISPVVVIVVKASPKSSESLLTIKQVFGNAFARCRSTLDGSRDEWLFVSDFEN